MKKKKEAWGSQAFPYAYFFKLLAELSYVKVLTTTWRTLTTYSSINFKLNTEVFR